MFRKFLGVSLLVMAAPAFAADINYNFVELGYQKIDFDEDPLPGISVDGDGYGIAGSFEVAESWFVGVGYAQADFDFGIDFNTLSLGLGWHTAMSDRADFFAVVSYEQAEAEASGFGSVDDSGYGLTIGIRGMVSDSVELAGSLGYVDFGDGGDGTAVGLGALYNFTENFAAGVQANFDEDVTAYGLGVRFYW